MTLAASANLYKHHRFPGDIISHAVWLYFRFCLSHRDVAELLFVRGIIVSYEAIRKRCRKFRQQYANRRCQLIRAHLVWSQQRDKRGLASD
jgi:putative transposase